MLYELRLVGHGLYVTSLNLLFTRKKLLLALCKMKPEVSIVIPAYNESDRLGGPLNTVLNFISTTDLSAEIIVVDDGSTDDTAKVVENVFASMPDVPSAVI